MATIIFLMYLDEVLAQSSLFWWNFLSDKSNGSIYTRILCTCMFCVFGFCQNFHLQLAESEDMEGSLCSWYFLLKGPENLWILVSLGAPETSLPLPPGTTVFGLLSSVPDSLQSTGEALVLLLITSPFLSHQVYVNEGAFGKHTRRAAGCQGNQVCVEGWNFQSLVLISGEGKGLDAEFISHAYVIKPQ